MLATFKIYILQGYTIVILVISLVYIIFLSKQDIPLCYKQSYARYYNVICEKCSIYIVHQHSNGSLIILISIYKKVVSSDNHKYYHF